MHLKHCNFRVPVFKGAPLQWMKWNPSFNDECRPTILVWRVSQFEMWILNYTTLGCPFIRGFPSHGWNETHPLTMSGYRSLKSFKFWKLHLKVCNFRVPVYKEVPLSWIKWNTSFSDDGWRNIRVWNVWLSEKWVLRWHPAFNDDKWPTIRVSKFSLSEKGVLNYTTWGFPFLRGFPPHPMNKMIEIL